MSEEYLMDEDSSDELGDILAEYEEKSKELGNVVVECKQEEDDHTAQEPQNKTSKRWHSKKAKRSLNEEVAMDKVLFGDKEGLLRNMARAVKKKADGSDDEGEEPQRKRRQPVWVDEDDEEIQLGHIKRETKRTGPLDHLRMDKAYKQHLTHHYKRIVSQPKWANLDHKPEVAGEDSDEEILRTVGFLAKGARDTTLQSHRIQLKQLKDLNRATYAEGPINCVEFHPTSTAALVAGDSGIATIYSIDGLKNEKLHSIKFPKFKIKCARITPCGTKAIFGSPMEYYYSYDLLAAQETRYFMPKGIKRAHNFELSPCGRFMVVAGRYGNIYLYQAKAQELIATLKQNDPVTSMKFTGDSKRLICASKGCNVNIFSLREQRLEHSFVDDGCIKGHALDLSPNQRLLATGSMEGVVNIYDFDSVLLSTAPQPEKRLLNLTTAISEVRFNHSSELLGMCSADVKGAMRLVHFPTGTVYANFPNANNNLGKIRTVSFSPSSGYMALGTRNKEVPLFRLKHFKNY